MLACAPWLRAGAGLEVKYNAAGPVVAASVGSWPGHVATLAAVASPLEALGGNEPAHIQQSSTPS